MKIMFISLGCDKNLVDTEMMLGILSEQGCSFTDDENEADIIVVNTCCFIGDAKEESINTLLEMGRLKETGNCRLLVAAGCLAQRYRDEIQSEIPEVDVIIGTMAIDKIGEIVRLYRERTAQDEKSRQNQVAGAGQEQGARFMEDINARPVYGKKRVVTTGGHYAYLKIAEGCNKHCTYCIIPKVRGDFRSIPMESLVAEAESLVSGGVRELILVAQETTLYGVDLYGEKKLPELLRRLAKIPGIYWIRLLYCYPEEITPELVETIAAESKICHYLDIPIQHASDSILKRMGRRTTQQQLRDKIAFLREKIPDICLRTTLITGFPGENEQDFEQLLQFVDEMEFDRLGVFTFSPEEDTPAASFPDQIPEEIKEDRRAQIMELQQDIAFEKAEEMTGRVIPVMIEGKVADENAYVGRTYKDAPGVDGLVFVNTQEELMTGDFVPVVITGSYEYDLIGEISYENEFTE